MKEREIAVAVDSYNLNDTIKVMEKLAYKIVRNTDSAIEEVLDNLAYLEEEETDMILKVNFKNGSSRDFVIDDYFISDNDICLYMRKNDRQVGMINLCEVRYFYVEVEE